MSGMLSLRVEEAAEIAEDIVRFDLRHPDGAALPEFTPGAHVEVVVPGGERRKYSLCNDPAERGRYVLAVKREPGGRGGSVRLLDGVRSGDRLDVSPPRNDFALTGRPARYLFIAGGIGITPIRSMMLHLASSGGPPFKLYYFTRTPAMMAFRDEFADPAWRGRAVLHHDGGDLARAFDLWPVLEQPKGAHLYCCGPRGLMQAVRDMTGHWPSTAVHFEDFNTTASACSAENRPFTVALARSGVTVPVPADQTILEALRAHGHLLPSSCESGTCGTCRTTLLAGEAEHRDLVLAEHERARAIMICVSRAASPSLTLDL